MMRGQYVCVLLAVFVMLLASAEAKKTADLARALSAVYSRASNAQQKREEAHGEEDPLHDLISHFDEGEIKDELLNAEEFEDLYVELFGQSEGGGEHDDGHGHGVNNVNNIGSRSSEVQLQGQNKREATSKSEEEGVDCHPAAEIFAENDADANGQLNETELESAVPTLLAMVVDKCKAEKKECEGMSTGLQWLAALVAAVIVSLLSLIVVVVFPLAHSEKLQNYMLAFAVGALVGDAILHLIPQALGVHGHGDEDEEKGELDYLGPAIMVLVGVWLFFLLERQLHFFHHHHHQHASELAEAEVATSSRKTSAKRISSSTGSSSASEETSEEQSENDNGSTQSSNVRISSDSSIFLRYEPLGFMIIVGDAVHNFVDGLAIGASFSTSFSVGLATTIAVFCHEVPQELADFAILLRSKFTKWQAVGLNFASGVTAIIGAIIGVGVGQAIGKANVYIIALIAGGFLYIALSDMVKDLLLEKGLQATITQAGLISLGFIVMVILTFIEEALVVVC